MKGSWWVGSSDLIDEQREVISLPLDGDHLVLGPPGSGKTNLLVLRANYLSLSGYENILILTFTRTLREFIAAGSDRYHFPSDKVRTYSYWQRKFLGEHGVTPAVQDGADFDESRRALLSQLNDLVNSRHLEKTYSGILVDEAQDYRLEELTLFSRLAERLFLVADSRQQIYKGNVTDEDLRNLTPSVSELRFHHRCGRKICRVADGLAKTAGIFPPLEESSNYDEKANPSELHLEKHATEEGQLRAMIARIELQLRAYPDELIGVLVPKRGLLSRVQAALEASASSGVVSSQDNESYVSFETGKRVYLATIHSAKGCEFRCLHLPLADELRDMPLPRNAAFTAVTRAQSTLSIYHTRALVGYFAEAVGRVFKPKSGPPSIDDVFGGGSD